MKLIVCESCEAEFRIKHSLDNRYYKEIYCPFCGEELQEELEDEIEDYEILNCILIKDNSRHYFEITVETETDVYEFLFDLVGDIIE